LGGRATPGGPSEADAGRAWLIAQGVPAGAIRIEDRSRHTLENLRLCRAVFPAPAGPVVLVTSRVHIARSGRMAAGLGLACQVCAAEPRRYAALRPLRLLLEAFLIHWYVVGSRFADLTGNAAMRARIR
ncbi:MAG: YdcF family protein, partial [Rhodospirillales bacterium]|nr:YdcF family protein [Rhodospirillales bacterium]